MSQEYQIRTPDELDRVWLNDLMDRANTGDREAIAELRKFVDKNPQLWRNLGDMASHAEKSWIGLICSQDPLLVESLLRETERKRQELLGDSYRPVEKILVDQIIATELELRHREQQRATGSGGTARQKSAILKSAESAHRRLMQATRTLEQIRAMPKQSAGRPSLRVVRAADAS